MRVVSLSGVSCSTIDGTVKTGLGVGKVNAMDIRFLVSKDISYVRDRSIYLFPRQSDAFPRTMGMVVYKRLHTSFRVIIFCSSQVRRVLFTTDFDIRGMTVIVASARLRLGQVLRRVRIRLAVNSVATPADP